MFIHKERSYGPPPQGLKHFLAAYHLPATCIVSPAGTEASGCELLCVCSAQVGWKPDIVQSKGRQSNAEWLF